MDDKSADTGADVDGARGSTEQLQESLHALLERHGVMLDLRAYLRTHLIGLVKSAQLGKPSVCKELLSQRLELKLQALNILIAEYLMRQDFKYTLSVFVSEIPLANMIFEFAATLVERTQRHQSTDIRFSEGDVWHVLNSLGVRCDSEHAGRIVDTYQSSPQKPSLLLCLLQSIQLYREERGNNAEPNAPDQQNLGHATNINVCDHIGSCETCQASRIMDRENYASKKKHFTEDIIQDSSEIRVGSRCRYEAMCDLDRVTAVEEDLINEMFHQLRSVHEEETEAQRERHERRLRRSLAACHQRLQHREQELEEEYESRRSELEASAEERKRFLWQLARNLRRQHADLAQAARDVQVEKRQLELREESIKEQLKTAEDILKRNGDEMRQQLSQELKVLEQHLDVLKDERESISQERNRLEILKLTIPNQSDEVKTEFEAQKRKNEDLQSHYDNLKEELSTVKNYIASSKFLEPKCLVETSSLTDICGVDNEFYAALNEVKKNFVDTWVMNGDKDNPTMNNSSVAKIAKHQLINDLSKLKNVNFKNDAVVQVNMDVGSLSGPASSPPADAGGCAHGISRQPQDNPGPHICTEQDRIRELVCVQRTLVAELASAQRVIDGMTRLAAAAAPLAAPPTPLPLPTHLSGHSAVSLCWGCGKASRADRTASPLPRDPGHLRPLGTLRSRESGRRSSVLSPWSRMRPAAARFRTHMSPARARDSLDVRPQLRSVFDDTQTMEASPGDSREGFTSTLTNPHRERHEDILQEESIYRQQTASQPREVKDGMAQEGNLSPTFGMLAAAKRRLRKLEIEAEAVEKSYRDFRNRRSADVTSAGINMKRDMTRDKIVLGKSPLEIHRSSSVFAKAAGYTDVMHIDSPSKVREVEQNNYFNRYLTEQMRRQEMNVSDTITFQSVQTNTAGIYSEKRLGDQEIVNKIKSKGNLIEKPLKEFRKLYQTNHIEAPSARINRAMQELRSNETPHNISKDKSIPIHVKRSKSSEHLKDAKLSALQLIYNRPVTADGTTSSKLTEAQLDVLRKNISKIYNIDYNTPHTNINEEKANDTLTDKYNLHSGKDDTFITMEHKKTLTRVNNEVFMEKDDTKSQSTKPKYDTVELLYATTKEKEENKNAIDVILANNCDISSKESCDIFDPASDTTIVSHNSIVNRETPLTLEPEASYHIDRTHTSRQSEEIENKNPTSILVPVESNLENEKYFLTKDTTIPISSTSTPTNTMGSTETHSNAHLLNNIIFKQVLSENYPLSYGHIPNITNANDKNKSTKSQIDSLIRDNKLEDELDSAFKNHTTIRSEEKNDNNIHEVDFANVKEVGELEKTEIIDAFVPKTPEKEIQDEYSNEGFSYDIESNGTENNEFDSETSAISIGKSVNESFWG